MGGAIMMSIWIVPTWNSARRWSHFGIYVCAVGAKTKDIQNNNLAMDGSLDGIKLWYIYIIHRAVIPAIRCILVDVSTCTKLSVSEVTGHGFIQWPLTYMCHCIPQRCKLGRWWLGVRRCSGCAQMQYDSCGEVRVEYALYSAFDDSVQPQNGEHSPHSQ